MQTFELINFGSKVLKEKLIPSYKLDSELLLANVLGKKREQMLISMNETVSRKNIEFPKILIVLILLLKEDQEVNQLPIF